MSLAALAGSAIQAGNLISQYSANSYNVQSQERQNEINRKFVLDMWNKENAYNTPKEQLRRLKAAGLNPGLMYENGAAGMPAAASHSPEQTAPQVQPLNVDPSVMANIELMQAQAENLRSQTKTQDAKREGEVENLSVLNKRARKEIEKMDKEQELIYAQITRYATQNAIDRDIADASIELWNSQADLNDELKIKTAEEYSQLVAFRQLKEQGLRASNEEIWSRIGVNREEAKRLMAVEQELRERMAFDYSDEVIELKQDLMDAQADLADAQANYWEDYVSHPSRFMIQTESEGYHGPFGTGYTYTSSGNYAPPYTTNGWSRRQRKKEKGKKRYKRQKN